VSSLLWASICTAFSSNGRLAPYLAKARIIYATIHPFLDLTRVFYAGLPEVAPEDEIGDDDPK
jgi:hypothetical protein